MTCLSMSNRAGQWRIWAPFEQFGLGFKTLEKPTALDLSFDDFSLFNHVIAHFKNSDLQTVDFANGSFGRNFF